MDTRRSFLAAVMLGAMSLGWAGSSQQLPPKPVPEPRTGPESNEGPSLPNPDKKILEENDKDMKKRVDRLYQLASELKEQVNKTDSSKVFSLNLMKKAEEIEKLAREIKNRSKG